MATSGDMIVKVNAGEILKLEKDGEGIIFDPKAEDAIVRLLEIQREVASTDGKRVYVAISAFFTGKIHSFFDGYYYIGELKENKDELSMMYIDKILNSLQKKYDARRSAGLEDEDGLQKIISEINTLIGRKL